MKTTRRSFLASIPFFAGLLAIKSPVPQVGRKSKYLLESCKPLRNTGIIVAEGLILDGQIVSVTTEGKVFASPDKPIGLALSNSENGYLAIRFI